MTSARTLRIGLVAVAAVLAGAIGLAVAGAKIDAVDEAVFAAPPLVVYQALLDEAAGRTSWWRPYWQAEARGEFPPDGVGGIFDATMRPPGTQATVHLVARIARVIPGRLIRVEYIEGDLRGEGVFTLEPVGDRTRLTFRFTVRPARMMLRLFAPAIRKRHRAAVRAGYAALAEHLRQVQGQIPES